MELKLSKRIEKLEVVAEDYYQTNIMDYLHIYSVHGVCQQNVQKIISLFTTYGSIGRLRPFVLSHFIIIVPLRLLS